VVAYAPNKKGFQLKRTGQSVRLEISAEAASSESQIDAVLSTAFLNQHDRFFEAVPEFWKTCVELAMARVENEKLPKCRFSEDLLALVGPNLPSAASSENRAAVVTGAATDPSYKVYRVGSGIIPPKPVFHNNPEFTDAARSADIQGKLTLGMIVDTSGLPAEIQVTQPLGAGLDAAAVGMVQNWKFMPAQKDAQPVAVRIEVEVGFRHDN
jgi:TonB family protein